MRSLLATFLIAIAAALALSLAVWQGQSGSLDALWGMPLSKRGSRLYPQLLIRDVKRMIIHKNGTTFSATLTEHGWECETPWQDRMDPNMARAILEFVANTRVVDGLPREKFKDSDTGLDDRNATNIRLENAEGRPLAKFLLGTKSPWNEPLEQAPDPRNPNAATTRYTTTVYMRPYDKNRKNFTYICEGDINLAFRNNFEHLRDHSPFFFNPLALQSLRIQDKEGLLILEKKSQQAPWRISKPLELATSKNQMIRLLEGLTKLKALKVNDRNGQTLPSTTQKRELSLQFFGQTNPVTLTIFQPETNTTNESSPLYATVSDRPNCLFELPATSQPDLPALDQIPLSINDLRDRNLAHFSPANLSKVEISASTLPQPISLERPKGKRWTYSDGKNQYPANELRLFDLFTAITQTEAKTYVTDAAVDLKPWGLDRPILSLKFFASQQPAPLANQPEITLLFGLGSDGALYAMRANTPSVMQISRELLSKIAIKPFEWRDARVWNLSRVDIVGIQRQILTQAPLLLQYDFLDESWKAQQNGVSTQKDINTDRANYLLSSLESLTAERWLAPDDAAALSALQQPVMRLTLLSKKINDEGNVTGLEKRELSLARSPDPRVFYATISGEKILFTVSAESVLRLTVDVLSH